MTCSVIGLYSIPSFRILVVLWSVSTLTLFASCNTRRVKSEYVYNSEKACNSEIDVEHTHLNIQIQGNHHHLYHYNTQAQTLREENCGLTGGSQLLPLYSSSLSLLKSILNTSSRMQRVFVSIRLVSESDINAHIDSGCNINTIRSTGSTSTSGSSGQSSSTSLFSTQKTVGLNTKSKAKDAFLNTEPAQPIKIAPLFTSKPKPSTNQSYTHAMPPNKSSGSVPQNQDLKRTRTDDDISPVNNTNLKRNRKEELMDSMPLAARGKV
ncbi:hypothetical protein PHYBLDRAFT_163474 [Phycomyces blakesleeanus NRRL 1555(-)]|uniref:Uncharacterized protein n=1 Tax=Phycomyces blakesleeanus (strain ATCC 8743b / DSM 1359 / FGSC 10004 / NBRC 33097 / NRRL 1555) TaxID=763407 RepID=A0A162UW00_PHYB8|nr:hypothetical protein PHYBLDRAFT_163474 [Phycomyces blakesleeanus NRRL 1555(-)]OAD78353.1 hypothetical protein PHYBLDRAFT_163474 [Phycomyces blakesleeanus NRRL 1555(-)]|eukprot:XP_018296393.1 hypothetical protein PHYBLDRAFT_163474 [Phycomyces blakesleeanus NRRL 1555(-)]